MTLHERMLLLHAIASEIVPDQIVELEDAASAAVDARTIELYKLMEDGIAGNPFAIERYSRCWKPGERIHDPWHPVGVVVAAPGEHPHPVALAPADEPEAVVLDLMHPVRPGRHGVAEVGRQGSMKPTGCVMQVISSGR
jgi:hypothetical protein